MGKKEMLLDSIKKLLALNVSEAEILLNLRDIGVDEENAKTLIAEAKGMPLQKQEEEEISKDSGKVMRDAAEKLAESNKMDETILNEEAAEMGRAYGVKDEEEHEFEEVETPKPKPAKKEKFAEKKIPKKKPEQPKVIVQPTELPPAQSYVNLNRLWEKGILVTVDQRLNEMKKIREELDRVIDEKVRQLVQKEFERERILLESQQKLLSEKSDAKLNDKAREISEIIDAKIREMKSLNDSVRESIKMLEKKEIEYKKALGDVEARIGDIQSTKQKLLQEMSAELIKSKSAAQDFLEQASLKMQEIDERVSKTLELQSHIAEGVIKDARDKIDTLALEKAEEIKKEIDVELKALREMKEKVNPDRINSQLDKLEKIAAQLAEEQKIVFRSVDSKIQAKLKEFDRAASKRLEEKESKLVGLQDLVEYKIKQAVSDYKTEYDKELSAKIAELESVREKIVSDIDPDSFKTAMRDLDTFKMQFLKVIEQNVGKFNAAINSINEQSNKLEEQINLRIKKIDQKMKELDEFEKTFAEEMGVAVDKVSNKKAKKK